VSVEVRPVNQAQKEKKMKVKFNLFNFIPIFILLLMVISGFIDWWIFVAIVISHMRFAPN